MTAVEFGSFINQLSPSLKPVALKLTRDREDANDLIQETVFKAISNREKFTDGTNLKAWLFTIMKNTFITNYQKMVRRNTFLDPSTNMHFLNSSTNSIENDAFSSFAIKDIKTAIDTLDDTYKVPFFMHFNGFKYYEISDRLGLPLGTVKNRIHIARKELKNLLKVYASN